MSAEINSMTCHIFIILYVVDLKRIQQRCPASDTSAGEARFWKMTTDGNSVPRVTLQLDLHSMQPRHSTTSTSHPRNTAFPWKLDSTASEHSDQTTVPTEQISSSTSNNTNCKQTPFPEIRHQLDRKLESGVFEIRPIVLKHGGDRNRTRVKPSFTLSGRPIIFKIHSKLTCERE